MKSAKRPILLLVGDVSERMQLKGLLGAIPSMPFGIQEMATGAEAIAFLKMTPPGRVHALLLNETLRDVDALALLNSLFHQSSFPCCPIIVLVGDTPVDGKQLLKQGAQDYLKKNGLTPEVLWRGLEIASERFSLLSERRSAEESLKLDTDRLAVSLQVAELALADVDYVTDINHLSAEAAKLFGLGETAMDVPRSVVHETFHPDDLAELLPRIAASLDPKGPGWFAMDHRIILPNGTTRWLRVRKQVFFDGPPGNLRPVRAALAALDVSMEHLAADALQQSNERIQLATAHTGVGIWEWNLITKSIRWDAQMFHIYGVTPTPDGQVPFTTWSDALLPEERVQQLLALNQFISCSGQGKREFHIQRANDNQIRTIQSVELVRNNASGHAEWVVGTNLDVTDKRLAAANVAVSETRFRRLFEAAHDGVLLLDPTTRKITEANPFMTQLLGYEHDRLIGKELFEIGLLKDVQASKQMFHQLNKDRQVRYEDLPLLSQDGHLREVEVVANLYQENKTTVIQCNIRDITARKADEGILRRSEALLSSLIEGAPLGIFVVDSHFRLQDINSWALPYFREITPLQGRDFGEIAAAIWPRKVADELIRNFRLILADGVPYLAPDLAERRVDSHEMEVYEWSLRRVTLPSGEFGVVCFVNEITERKQEEITERRLAVITALNRNMERDIARRKVVEEELKSSQRSTSDLLEKSTLLQAQHRKLTHQLLFAQEEERKRISRELHDVIAQSLTSINYRLGALQSKSPEIAADPSDTISKAQEAVEQAVEIVHQFARDLRPSMLDDLGLIPALKTYVSEIMVRTQIEVKLEEDGCADCLSNSLITVLYRIVQESLTNVSRHAQAKHVLIRLSAQMDSVVLEIVDDGIGFKTDENGASAKESRLGLVGMRERVEMVGGNFAVHSNPGGPTTVRVEIPSDNHAPSSTISQAN